MRDKSPDALIRQYVQGLLKNDIDQSSQATKDMVTYVMDNPVPVAIEHIPKPVLSPMSKWPFITYAQSHEAMENAAHTRTQKWWQDIDPDLREEYEAGWEAARVWLDGLETTNPREASLPEVPMAAPPLTGYTVKGSHLVRGKFCLYPTDEFPQGMLILDDTGMTYKGQRITDGGEAYKDWQEVVSAIRGK